MIESQTGARYAIVIDGTVRTHRDLREAAFEAANVLKALNPYCKVSDLHTGAEIDPQKPGMSDHVTKPSLNCGTWGRIHF
jgi:hypothetical protein